MSLKSIGRPLFCRCGHLLVWSLQWRKRTVVTTYPSIKPMRNIPDMQHFTEILFIKFLFSPERGTSKAVKRERLFEGWFRSWANKSSPAVRFQVLIFAHVLPLVEAIKERFNRRKINMVCLLETGNRDKAPLTRISQTIHASLHSCHSGEECPLHTVSKAFEGLERIAVLETYWPEVD